MGYHLTQIKKEIEISGLYTLFYAEHGKDFYFSGERHDFWEMAYADSGEISVMADNNGYLLHQGDVIFHRPMEFHALASNRNQPHNLMVVSFETQSEAMHFFEQKIISLDNHQKKILSLLLEESREAFEFETELKIKKGAFGAPQLVVNYLEQFLILLLRAGVSEIRDSRKSIHAKKNVENAFVSALENYLESHVEDTLCLDDICSAFHISKSYICRLFKEETGESIIDTYLSMKIAHAKTLIRQGDLNITQISQKLNYSGIHHFSRSFKKYAGMSPTNYAKSVQS